MYNRYEAEKKCVVFGTGLDGVKCIYNLQERGIKIEYCLNNNCKEIEFCGYRVLEPNKENMKGIFLYVAVSIRAYPIISAQLRDNGLLEFKDYIYYEWLQKKIVLLHGNCHMEIIRQFLFSSKVFSSRYSIYPNPLVCQNSTGRIEKSVLENCDIWIHEDIRSDNEFGYYLSDEYMRQFVKADIIEIIVPHLFGLGKAFFPQSEWNNRNKRIRNGEDANGMFPHADRIIDRCVEQGMKGKQIIEFCISDNSMSRQEIKDNFELYINKMRAREKNWDIKIVDYIMENYKEQMLFYDMGHPTNSIFKVISTAILRNIGIDDENISANMCLDAHEEPVYPIVKKVLGMKWENHLIRNSLMGKKARSEMDFKEYIAEYLWWCYGIK